MGLLWGSRRHADTAILRSMRRRCSSTETPPTKRLFRNQKKENIKYYFKREPWFPTPSQFCGSHSHLLWVRICISNFSSPVNSQAIGHSNLWKDKMYFKLQWLCCYKSKCSFGIWDEKANKLGLGKLMSKKVSVVRCKNFLYLIIKSNFVNEIEYSMYIFLLGLLSMQCL